MGFLDFSFYHDEESAAAFPKLHVGMSIAVIMQNGETLFTGKLTAFDRESVTLEQMVRLGRTSGDLSVGGSDGMAELKLDGDIWDPSQIAERSEATGTSDKRGSFRLTVEEPMVLYRQEDADHRHPEKCTLVDISMTGACVGSGCVHEEDEILQLQVELEGRHSMFLWGQVVRASETGAGQYRYGILFAQLLENELVQLCKVLCSMQEAARPSPFKDVESQGG